MRDLLSQTRVRCTHFIEEFNKRVPSHWLIGPCVHVAWTLVFITTAISASWYIVHFIDANANIRQQEIQPAEYHQLLTQLDALPTIPPEIRDSFADHIVTNEEYERSQQILSQNSMEYLQTRLEHILARPTQPGIQ